MWARMRGRERGHWLKQTKNRKNICCDLSFNSAELKMHPLSHWQADRVRTPTGQQSTAWPSCWRWVGGFQGALFHSATLSNIKKKKLQINLNRTRLEHQVDPTVKLIFEKVFEDHNHRCCLSTLSVPCYVNARTTAEVQFTVAVFIFRKMVSDKHKQLENHRCSYK